MRIVTYNMLKGGRGDYSTLHRVIDRLQPDFLFAQEACSPATYHSKNPQFREAQYVDKMVWGKAGNNYWGSLVYAREAAIISCRLPNTSLNGWVQGADIVQHDYSSTASRPLRMFSIHNPKPKGSNYYREINHILDNIRSLTSGHDVIIAGDFNITISKRSTLEAQENTAEENALIVRLQNEFQFINCWQECNPNQHLAQTFHGNRSSSRVHHIDGIFVPHTWKHLLSKCEIISPPEHIWAEGDHYPVVADFNENK